MNLLEVLSGANVALRLLQARLVTILALLIAAGLFAWAMWRQTALGAIIASIWGLSVFLPVLYTDRGGRDGETAQRDPETPGDEPARGPTHRT